MPKSLFCITAELADGIISLITELGDCGINIIYANCIISAALDVAARLRYCVFIDCFDKACHEIDCAVESLCLIESYFDLFALRYEVYRNKYCYLTDIVAGLLKDVAAMKGTIRQHYRK